VEHAGTFRERLTPPPLALLVGAALGAAVGLVVYPFAETAAYLVGVLAAVGVVGALVASAPVVTVTDGWLRAGRARVAGTYLGEPEVLRGEDLRRVLGPAADARAYVCSTPWARSAVRVPLLDPQDPAPYWLVGTARPDELARALRSSGQAAHSEQTSWPPSS
jgi:hypothetical protein